MRISKKSKNEETEIASEMSKEVVLEETPVTLCAIPMILTCISCGARHIDGISTDGTDWAKNPHHTHACQKCGVVWRPAIVPTVGVRFLPGFKNDGVPPGKQPRPIIRRTKKKKSSSILAPDDRQTVLFDLDETSTVDNQERP